MIIEATANKEALFVKVVLQHLIDFVGKTCFGRYPVKLGVTATSCGLTLDSFHVTHRVDVDHIPEVLQKRGYDIGIAAHNNIKRPAGSLGNFSQSVNMELPARFLPAPVMNS